MKRILIVGAAGFVGNHLIEYIKNNRDWQIAATKLKHEALFHNDIAVYDLDITDKLYIKKTLNDFMPDYIVYLAAQSSVALSWKNPDLTIDINAKGCLNMLEVIHEENIPSRILLIGSSEEYGYISASKACISEDDRVIPGNIYAATKAFQNMIGYIYFKAYGIDVISVRAFNHIGPGQAPAFVVADFSKQIAEIEKGYRAPIIKAGNLDVKRDFTDVRDIVEAYVLLLENGETGETYNVGSGKAVAIRDLLDSLLGLSSTRITVEVDPAKLRPTDIPIITSDISKLQSCIYWAPRIPIEKTLKDTLDYWRCKQDSSK